MEISSRYDTASTSLLRKVCEFDDDAWSRLVALYGPLVYRWARTAGLQEDQAADIGQEVFHTVFERCDLFSRDLPHQSFRLWIKAITRNKIGDFYRRVKRQPQAVGLSDVELSEHSDISGDDDDRETTWILQRALALIRTDYVDRTWQAFLMAVVEEKPCKQIAEELGMTEKAVRQAKYRVLKRLRDEFAELVS